jgi:hypothetical protein
LARGSESALSTLTLLASGTIAELHGLRVIVASIGAAALFLAPFLDGPDAVEPLPSGGRSRLYVDASRPRIITNLHRPKQLPGRSVSSGVRQVPRSGVGGLDTGAVES